MVERSKARETLKSATTRTKTAAEVAKGKLESKTGKAIGDRGLQARGKIDEAKGHVKQATQKLRETGK